MLKQVYWQIQKEYYRIQKSLHELKHVAFELTQVCNLNCKHCYMNATSFSETDLNTQQWKNIVDQIYKNYGNKISIGITGGEPLMRKDIFDIINHLKSYDFQVNLTTNGILLTQKNIKQLCENIFAMSISLDGIEAGHNYLRQAKVFDRTFEKMRLCKQNGLKFLVVKTAVYKKNLGELKNLYEKLKNSGVDEWNIFAVEPLGRANLHLDEILDKKEYTILCDFIDQIKSDKTHNMRIRFGEEGSDFAYKKSCESCKFRLCMAGITNCSILSNGDVVSCMQTNRQKIYGNIKFDSFKNIWENGFSENRHKDYTSCGMHKF